MANEGYKLLKLFRAEQKKNGYSNYVGCMCIQCITDMEKAFKELMNQLE